MIYGERTLVDSEGFQYKYVPKEKIGLGQDLKDSKGRSIKNSRKVSNATSESSSKAYIYVKKQ